VLRLLLADDHAMMRDGLRALLDARGMRVVGEASDGREAVRMALSLPCDVAILDVGMPGLNGLEAARAIGRQSKSIHIVMLTLHSESEYVVAALRAGVRGYVLKSQASSDLVAAIETVIAGGTYLSPGISQTIAEAVENGTEPESEKLTPREREVLQLVSEGHSTKQVAGVLDISVKTVETHRTRIMRKLGVHETASLVRLAIRSGLVSD
jgi:DNA-binding NarL/FixJ family response regulator